METPGQLLWLHVEVGVQGCPPSEALAEILTWGQGRGGDPLSGLGLFSPNLPSVDTFLFSTLQPLPRCTLSLIPWPQGLTLPGSPTQLGPSPTPFFLTLCTRTKFFVTSSLVRMEVGGGNSLSKE